MTEDSYSDRPKVRSISKDEINALPLISWKGRIEILNTIEEMETAVDSLKRKTLLGFDTETRPSFKKGDYYPPALVQLGDEDCIYLFRICKTKTLEPLLPILEAANILKVGVAIKDDVKELKKMEDFEPSGFFEITDLTTTLGYKNRGLRALAGLLMKGRISKAAQVSNWERADLSPKQINYAATDAWVSCELYCRAITEQDHD